MKLRGTHLSLGGNLLFAMAHCALGFYEHSRWFVTLGAYYFILSAARFCVLRSIGHAETERFAKKLTGILFIALSFCLAGMVILAAIRDRGTDHHEIVMITIAVYAFTKITLAIIRLVKSRRLKSPAEKTLRNISLVEAIVSIYSLQRSMLVSFPGMEPADIQLFNILTGSAVWLLILVSGLNLIGGRCTTMAKSKLVKANEKIAETVTEGYKKIEKGVVDGYKKIEQGVTEGYGKIEDKFIDSYLTKEGETVEEAKARLKKKEQ